MDAQGARLGERPGQRDRVAGPLDHLVVRSLVQPHGALAEDVHRGDHLDLEVKPLL